MIARATGTPLSTVLKMTPAEIAGWRWHFMRWPPDGVERLLSSIILGLSKGATDDQVRPWRYSTPAAQRELKQVKTEKADRDLTAFMSG